MKWYKDLYCGELTKNRKNDLIQQLNEGKTPKMVYLITLASGSVNQLEIISTSHIRHWYEYGEIPVILGIATHRQEVLALVEQITNDVYQATGGADLKKYFLERIETE